MSTSEITLCVRWAPIGHLNTTCSSVVPNNYGMVDSNGRLSLQFIVKILYLNFNGNVTDLNEFQDASKLIFNNKFVYLK